MSFDDRIVLLTGVAGYIGGLFWRTNQHHDLEPLDPNLDINSDLFQEYVANLGEEIYAIVHCAGNSIISDCEIDPLAAFRNNTLATASVLEAARKLPVSVPVVVLESDKVYGVQSLKPLTETAPLNGFSPYEKSKVLAAELCDFYRDYYGMNVISLRLTNTYGYSDNNLSRLIPGTIDRLRRGEAPMIWEGSEDHRRDYLFDYDLMAVIAEFVSNDHLAGAYNVTSEENYSTREVIDIIQEEMGTKLPILYNKKNFSEIPYQRIDGGKLRKEIGCLAPSTKLREGIRNILDLYD